MRGGPRVFGLGGDDIEGGQAGSKSETQPLIEQVFTAASVYMTKTYSMFPVIVVSWLGALAGVYWR